MQKTIWALLLVIAATSSTTGQTAADGEIVGRITDSQAAALPGVRIVISSSDEQREAITDNDGRFVVGMLKLGTHRVAAELAGFLSRSSVITLSPTTPRAFIGWPLEVGCLNEVLRVILGAREAASMVDAIVHIRVKSDNGPLLWYQRPECAGIEMQSYTVEVLNAMQVGGKDDGRTNREILMWPKGLRLKPGGEVLDNALAGVARG